MSDDGDERIFLRDTIKKKHGFLGGRRRSLSYTDAVIGRVFEQLKALVAERRVERFRVVFGSDIVELRFGANPLMPVTLRTDRFLSGGDALKAPVFDPAKIIPTGQIEPILAKMKQLRDKDRKFLEAFRINACGDDVWVYFSSALSLFGSHRDFLAYTELRDLQEQVNAEMETLLTFRGDEFEHLADLVVREEETLADRHCDEINAKTTELFQQHRIVEFQLYCGSGLIRVIGADDLHTPRHYTVHQYLDDRDLARAGPLTWEQGVPTERAPRPQRLPSATLARMLELAAKLRSQDDELYLRVLYVDVVNDTVVASFSCGGTYCQTAEEFIESDFARD